MPTQEERLKLVREELDQIYKNQKANEVCILDEIEYTFACFTCNILLAGIEEGKDAEDLIVEAEELVQQNKIDLQKAIEAKQLLK